MFTGARLAAGFWFDPEQRGLFASACQPGLGLEVGGFVLMRKTATQAVSSDGSGNPPLFLPFVDTSLTPPAENAFLLASGGLGTQAGGLLVTATSQLWGADANVLLRLVNTRNVNWLLLAGPRYLDLRENLELLAHTTFLVDQPGIPMGTTVVF